MKVPNSYFFLNIFKNRLKWIKNPNLHDSPFGRSLPLESSLSQLLALSIIVWHCTHHTILHQSLMQPHSTIQHVLLPFLEAPAPKVQLMEVEGGIWTIFDYYSHGRPDSG